MAFVVSASRSLSKSRITWQTSALGLSLNLSRVTALLPRPRGSSRIRARVCDYVEAAAKHEPVDYHIRPTSTVTNGVHRRYLPPWAWASLMTQNSTTYQVSAQERNPEMIVVGRARLMIRRDVETRGSRSARQRTATCSRQTQQDWYYTSTTAQQRSQRSAELAALAPRPYYGRSMPTIRYSLDAVATPRCQHADTVVVFRKEYHTDRALDWLASARCGSRWVLLCAERKSLWQETFVSTRDSTLR